MEKCQTDPSAEGGAERPAPVEKLRPPSLALGPGRGGCAED